MATQFLTTSKLSNIINMIALGQQSGILRVIRGQGPTREIGQIKFLNGQPVSALLGTLTNASALNVLSNWGECVYSFDEYSAGDANGREASLDNYAASQPDLGPSSPPVGLSSGSWPSYGYGTSYPMQSPPMPSGPLYSDGFTGGLPNLDSQQTGYSSSYPPGYIPGAPAPSTSTSSEMSRYAGQPVLKTPPNGPQNVPTPSWQLLNAIPQRTILSEQVEQLPLDRRERMVLLLVDGRRSITDLARLTRRNERELLAVLHHLNALGLIQMG